MMRYDEGPWTFLWHGGRLADIHHAECNEAVACITVGSYDIASGRHVHNGRTSLREAAKAWLETDEPHDCADSLGFRSY